MSVRKKGRRKIVCNNKNYVWYVEEAYEYSGYVLHIISDDKKIILAYPLDTIPYVVSIGKVFQNYQSDGCWARYLVPIQQVSVITPKFVSELINWATEGENAIRIAYNAKDIWF